MAARLLLRQGQAGTLKAVLEAQVFRGLASSVPLSAESGKAGKGLPQYPKKPSPPKDIVEPKEREQLLATHAAVPLPQSPSPPSSHPVVGSTGVALAGSLPAGSPPLTDEGILKPLSKTLVEFPQKVPAPFRQQFSNLETQQHAQKAKNDSSSSSSSSSSSDSESEEDGHGSEVDPRVAGHGKGGLPKPEVTYSFENRAPQTAVSAKEKARVQRSHTDVTQPGKKGTFTKPLEDRKELNPKPAAARSQSSKEALKQKVKEGGPQEKLFLNEAGEKSPKPPEAKGILPEHTQAGSSAGLSDGPPPMLRTKEAGAGRRLPAATPGVQVPEPRRKAGPPPVKGEGLEKPVLQVHTESKEENLEDEEPVRDPKTVPGQKKGVLEKRTAGPKLEQHLCEAAVKGVQPMDASPHQEPHVDTQEPTQAPQPTDTTTYKNLQHHAYNLYTFLDLNLDLSKFRMPQPSSGRESPRH